MRIPKPSSPTTFLLLAAATYYAAFIARCTVTIDGTVYFTLFDDAMISMRYARNLADGFGLVWNPGETPVEGFTNPLWTLWMALLHLPPIPAPVLPVLVATSGALCLMACAWLSGRLVLAISPGATRAALAAMAVTAFYFPLVYWSLRGMEVGLVAALMTAVVLASTRLVNDCSRGAIARLSALLGLLLWVRADAIVPVAMIVAFLLVRLRGKDRRRAVFGLALAIAVVAGVLETLRVLYYGELLPNTYYLKVAGVSVRERVGVGLLMFAKTLATHFWLFVPLVAVMALTDWRRVIRGPQLLLLLVFGGQIVYSIWVGGDIEEYVEFGNRFMAVGVPVAIAFVCSGLADAGLNAVRLRGVLLLIAAGIVAMAAARFGALRLEDTWGLYWAEFRVLAVITGITLALLAFVAVRERRAVSRGVRLDRVSAAGLVVAMFLSLAGYPLLDWVRHNAPAADTDAIMTRLGLELARRTPDDTVIAVVYAGSTPYWSRLPSVDLLGKNDAIIARGPSTGRFQPGHSKWNYRHSVAAGHPDLILQTFRLTDADHRFLEEAGYRLLSNRMYLDTRSSRVRAEQVEDIQPPMRHLQSMRTAGVR